MTERDQLNAAHYQQAVRFAENFANDTKQEYLNELRDRHDFEKTQLALQLQKIPQKRPLVFGMLAFIAVLTVSVAYYWQSGRYQQVEAGERDFQAFQQQKAEEDSRTRNDHYIVSLQNQLRDNPNNGDLWFELGQAYSLNNDFEAAMVCFHHAQTVLGRKPAILGAMATTDYYLHKQTLSAQAKAWIDEALAQDPKESASLLLLASEAFLRNDPQQAIFYWQQVLDGDNPNINRRAIIQSINTAEERMKTN